MQRSSVSRATWGIPLIQSGRWSLILAMVMPDLLAMDVEGGPIAVASRGACAKGAPPETFLPAFAHPISVQDQLHMENEERRRIAQELHDTIVQDIVGIRLTLERVRHLECDEIARLAFAPILCTAADRCVSTVLTPSLRMSAMRLGWRRARAPIVIMAFPSSWPCIGKSARRCNPGYSLRPPDKIAASAPAPGFAAMDAVTFQAGCNPPQPQRAIRQGRSGQPKARRNAAGRADPPILRLRNLLRSG